jgi:hypothetical protein
MQSPYPAPTKTLRLGDALELGGSLVVFAFSFAPFITISIPGLFGGNGLDDSRNAWATEMFMAPLTWFVVLAGLLQIAAVALRYPGGRNPELLGFRLPQLEVGLGLFMLVVLFSMVTSDKEGLGTGWGAILMLVGALAAAAGAVLTHLSVGPTVFPMPARPATPTTPGQPYPPAGTQPYAGPPHQAQPYGPEGQPLAPPAAPPPPANPPQQSS